MLKQIETNTAYYYKLLYAPKGLGYLDLILNNEEYIKAFTKNRGAANVVFGGQNTTRGTDIYNRVVSKPEIYKELFNTWCKTKLGELAVKSNFIDTINDAQSILNILSNTTVAEEFNKYDFTVPQSITDNVLLWNKICLLDTNNVLSNYINTEVPFYTNSNISATKILLHSYNLDYTKYNDMPSVCQDPMYIDTLFTNDTAVVAIKEHDLLFNSVYNSLSGLQHIVTSSSILQTLNNTATEIFYKENPLVQSIFEKHSDVIQKVFADASLATYLKDSAIAVTGIRNNANIKNMFTLDTTFRESILANADNCAILIDDNYANILCAGTTYQEEIYNLNYFNNLKYIDSFITVLASNAELLYKLCKGTREHLIALEDCSFAKCYQTLFETLTNATSLFTITSSSYWENEYTNSDARYYFYDSSISSSAPAEDLSRIVLVKSIRTEDNASPYYLSSCLTSSLIDAETPAKYVGKMYFSAAYYSYRSSASDYDHMGIRYAAFKVL